MDWTSPIDAYCERLDASFWSEPVNALTNLAFLVAAGLAWARLRAAGGRDLPAALLVGVAALVGIGSFLFHTFANRWSVLADVVPIQLFILGYLALALARFLGLAWPLALLGAAAFAGVTFLLPRTLPAPLPPAPTGYVAALAAIFAVGLAARLRGGAEAPRVAASLWATGLVFLASLTFRELDIPLCPAVATGTHGLWHLLNALVLYRLLRLAIDLRRTG